MPTRPILPLPYPHFMAFAPLDCWARLLWSPFALVGPRYWPRLLFALFCSALATLATLPERLILAPILRWHARRTDHRLRHAPGAVVVLGYFRSGTTHLHYLLSCDPRLVTPTWAQALCPQGWALSWQFLRIFMIPFISATRPQDDVAIGPDWPAEDDFAVNNSSAASSLPARFVLPRLHHHYARFHALDRLTPRELTRWRDSQWAFLRKLAWLHPPRAILLKSPSHTARVSELARMLAGPEATQPVRFVHISRDPAAVITSNVNMARRLGVFNLQDPPGDDQTRARVVEEYLATEEKYLAQSAALPAGSLVEIRYEDLVADPIATLKRLYSAIGLEWSPDAEARMLTYLATVRDYRAANQRDAKAAAPAQGGDAPDDEARRIAALSRRFGHDQPAIPRVAPPAVELGGSARRTRRAVVMIVVAAVVAIPLWLAQAWVLQDRHDWLVWPLGVALGLLGIRVAREGSPRLGLVAALATLAVYALCVGPATFLMDYGQRPNYFAAPGEPRAFWGLSPWVTPDRWEWDHIAKATRAGALATNNIFYLFMGLVTAYRFASRRHVNPPGIG